MWVFNYLNVLIMVQICIPQSVCALGAYWNERSKKFYQIYRTEMGGEIEENQKLTKFVFCGDL